MTKNNIAIAVSFFKEVVFVSSTAVVCHAGMTSTKKTITISICNDTYIRLPADKENHTMSTTIWMTQL